MNLLNDWINKYIYFIILKWLEFDFKSKNEMKIIYWLNESLLKWNEMLFKNNLLYNNITKIIN